MERLQKGDVVSLLFRRRDSRRAARALLEMLRSKGGRCTAREMSEFARRLAIGDPCKFSRTNFYRSILKRFVELGFIAELPYYNAVTKRVIKSYTIVHQPIGIRRPMGPSFVYYAHRVSEAWNEYVAS
jgi:hypothetical protein